METNKPTKVIAQKVKDTKNYTRYEVAPGQGCIGTVYVPLSLGSPEQVIVTVEAKA